MKKLTNKKIPVAMTRKMAFVLSDKLELKIKRIMKKLKLKSFSAVIRVCIEEYK